MIEYVKHAMRDLAFRFNNEGELAQLLLTSKIENTIRDNLMLSLNNLFQINNNEHIAVREVKRFDTVIFEKNETISNNDARLIIELKAMYSFDTLFGPMDFIEGLIKDICKFKKNQRNFPNAKLLLILLGHHILDDVNPASLTIKYSSSIHQSFNQKDSENDILISCNRILKEQIQINNIGKIKEQNRIIGGTGLHDIRADLLYWIISPNMEYNCNNY